MRHRHQQQQWIWGAIAALSLALTSCGPSKTAQCKQIIQTIQQAEAQRSLGEQTRQTRLADAQLFQILAEDLAAMDIKNRALRDHRTQLVEAYHSMVTAINRHIKSSNEAGRLSYQAGDSQAEAAVKSILAEQIQAQNKVNLAEDLLYITCRGVADSGDELRLVTPKNSFKIIPPLSNAPAGNRRWLPKKLTEVSLSSPIDSI